MISVKVGAVNKEEGEDRLHRSLSTLEREQIAKRARSILTGERGLVSDRLRERNEDGLTVSRNQSSARDLETMMEDPG